MPVAKGLCPTCPLRVLEGALIQSTNGVMSPIDHKRVSRAAQGVVRMARTRSASAPRPVVKLRKVVVINKVPARKKGCRVCLSVIEKDGPLVPMVHTLAKRAGTPVHGRSDVEYTARRVLKMLRSMREDTEE